MKPLYLFTLVALIGGIRSAHGQSPDTIRLSSLNQVTQVAIKKNPTQAVYQLQITQAGYEYKASKSYLWPNISGTASGTNNLHLAVTPVPGEILGRPGTTYYAQFGKKYVYTAGININRDILDWTAMLQMKIADQNVELSRLQQASFAQSLKEQVARLYFSIQVAQYALEINRKDSLLADSVLALTRQRLQEGTTDLVSVNQAAINSANIKQSQAQSRQLYDQSIENLKILLGEKPADELQLTEPLNLDSLLVTRTPALGLDKNLDVYRQQADIAAIQSRSQRSAAYPKLAAAGYFGDQQFRDDFGLSFGNNSWSSNTYVGLNLNVPLFTGFYNSNKYKSALTQKAIARQQYDNAAQQSEINDRLLLKNDADYQQMNSATAESYRLYQSTLRLNKQKYDEGLISMDTYLKTFQDYLTAENAWLNALSQLLSIRSTLISRL